MHVKRTNFDPHITTSAMGRMQWRNILFIFLIISPHFSTSIIHDNIKQLFEQRLNEYKKQNYIYSQVLAPPTSSTSSTTSTSNISPHLLYYQNHKINLIPHRTGIRGISAIINDNYSLIMCTIPKIGSSTWRKFMLYLTFPDLITNDGQINYYKKFGVLSPDAHNISKNGVKLMALQTPQEALNYYNNPKYLKLFHTRNPITRILSAWLSKNAMSNNPLPFAKYSPTFEIFIKVLISSSSFFVC